MTKNEKEDTPSTAFINIVLGVGMYLSFGFLDSINQVWWWVVMIFAPVAIWSGIVTLLRSGGGWIAWGVVAILTVGLGSVAVSVIGLLSHYSERNAGAAESAAPSSAATPAGHKAATPAPQPQPLVTQQSQPQPQLAPELSREIYVASEDADVYHFVVKHPSKVRLRAMIEGNVPVDIVTSSGKYSREQWVMAATSGETLSLLATVFGGQSLPDVFATPLSKKAAFRVFESPWVDTEPGEYTVILDNTQAYTPSRGDAVVRLELYSAQ